MTEAIVCLSQVNITVIDCIICTELLNFSREKRRCVEHDQTEQKGINGHVGGEYKPSIPASIGSTRGLAGHLYRAMVDFARDEKLQVTPTCSYVIHKFERHPENGDVLRRSTF
jgi:hypothetical protein